MRIGDWSSDVCSSDLIARAAEPLRRRERFHQPPARLVRAAEDADLAGADEVAQRIHHLVIWRVMVGPVRLLKFDFVGLVSRHAFFVRLDFILAFVLFLSVSFLPLLPAISLPPSL